MDDMEEDEKEDNHVAVNNINMKNSAASEKISPEDVNGAVETTMRRHLTLFNLVSMLVSITGHVAVFITPGAIVDMSGSIVSTLILWCIGGFTVYSLALCFNEMSGIFQGAGGPYIYLTLTFGNLSGFLTVWGYLILIAGPFVTFTAQIAALYIIKAITLGSTCSLVWHDLAAQLLAGWLIIALALMNCFCLKMLVRVQNFLTSCKMVAIAIIIAAGIYVLVTDSADNLNDPLEGSHADPGRISLSLLYINFSIGGWQTVSTLTEEVKDPARTLPRAIHITFAVVLVLFLLTYVSYMVVLEKHDIIHTKAIALLFCQRVWTPLVPVMSVLVALASIGSLSTGIMGYSRMLFAAARKGDMPSLLGTLHPVHRTPMMAVCTVTVYAILMMYSGGVEKLMQFIGLYSLIMAVKVVVALLYLRYTKPKLSRTYKVPLFFPLLQLITSVFLLCFIVVQEPVWMSYGILIYLAGVPIYLVCIGWKRKPKVYVRFIGRVTSTIQKLFRQIPT